MNPSTGSGAETPIQVYLDEVAARLYGPRRARTRILAELRDGLEQAVADRTDRGEPAGRAATAATAEFGAPDVVTAAFAGELATAYARQTLITYVATGPLVGICWLLLLHPDPWRTGLAASITAIPVLPLIAAGLATSAGALATTGRLMRWLPETSPGRALAATATVAGLTMAGDLIIIGVAGHSGFLTRPLAVIAVTAGLARIAYSLRTILSVGTWPRRPALGLKHLLRRRTTG
ncbi:permease prefix domain 1-containing protein [Actinoplanes solisilvae]|uniref:permease prefix domain 1-containing protein n=1 Tax=Actinoplanes solisilvae TaxID=2486853 RepID=UPI000FD76DCB|nr:permease prefix domain 1-containing protein [Actinoplanes solisilvae]